jgi:hypothetical protein
MVNKNKKPVLTPALSSEEREKRLPRLDQIVAMDLRCFRRRMRTASATVSSGNIRKATLLH